MSKIKQAVEGVRNFSGEVRTELKKCTWPSRSELVDSTVIVIISVAIIGTFVGVSDIVLREILDLIVR